jgi:hypothetical protein
MSAVAAVEYLSTDILKKTLILTAGKVRVIDAFERSVVKVE